ncbi:MAG: DUF2817 domain-containing protein [Planctomycetota bacterium]
MSQKWATTSTICVLLTVLAFAGCYKPVDFPQIVGPIYPPPTVLPSRYYIVGKSVEGRPIMCLVLGQGADTSFIMGGIHGNEPAGPPLVRWLANHLRQNPVLLNGRTVVLLSSANPDGIVRSTRYNAHGVDLNRNFEAANRVNSKETGLTSLSEPETRAIQQIILKYALDRIVSIHQPLACIDYDGPAQVLANHMGKYCDLPVKKVGARPGSLGSYAGVTRGIPIVTFEMRASDSQLDSQTLWRRYGKALLAAVVYPEAVK